MKAQIDTFNTGFGTKRNKVESENFEIKKTRFEALQDKYSNIEFHKGFEYLDTGLIRLGFNPTLNGFIQGTTFFLYYYGLNARVLVQMSINGKTLDCFREIEFSRADDVLNNIEQLNNQTLILHTKPEQRKNLLTRIANFFLKLDKVYYGQ